MIASELGRGYTDFLQFVLVGDLAKFYDGQRWLGWQEEVGSLAGDRAFHFYPFLGAKCEGGLEARSRKAVPIEELWGLHAVDLPRQLHGGTLR